MGIPSYFAFLVNKYPNIIRNNLNKSVARLYLDLNGAIHPCCRKIMNQYGDSLDNEILEKKMIKEILEYIELMILEVNRDEMYEGCPLVEELDTFLEKYNFKRVHTLWQSISWGDAIYAKWT